MQTILSLLLAAILLLTAAGRPDRAQEPSAPADKAVMADALPSGTASLPDRDTDWADMRYSRYDPAWFYEQTDRLSALSAGDDAEAATGLYDTLSRELSRIDTLGSIAYIRHCADVTDAYWSGESQYCATLLAEAADALSCACRDLTQGPCAEAFKEHVGPDLAEEFAVYEPMTAREAELAAREAELVDEYTALMNDTSAVTYSYLGRTWTWDMISGFPGTSLADRDHDGYLEVYYGLQKGLNDLVGPVYTELVGIRAELARIAGYDSYADMAYERTYGRDYGPEQAQALCDAVKALGPDRYGALGYSPLWYDYGAVRLPDSAQPLNALETFVGRVDPALADTWRFMRDHGLCDVSAGEDRFPGSFTVPLRWYGSAYIFAQPVETCYDLSSLAHEFGHFAYEYRHPGTGLLSGPACFDLLEVHSTGLETLLMAYYDELYAEGAPTARFLALGDLLDALLEGCVFDEFQRRVYAQPDMTLDGMNRLFADICREYGQEEPRDVDYSWMYVSHTFESPLYYISYAVSALAAIQLWELSRTDWQSAVDAWERVMDADVCRDGYMTVLPACGLRLFTEEGAVAEICRPLLEEMTRLSAGA